MPIQNRGVWERTKDGVDYIIHHYDDCVEIIYDAGNRQYRRVRVTEKRFEVKGADKIIKQHKKRGG